MCNCSAGLKSPIDTQTHKLQSKNISTTTILRIQCKKRHCNAILSILLVAGRKTGVERMRLGSERVIKSLFAPHPSSIQSSCIDFAQSLSSLINPDPFHFYSFQLYNMCLELRRHWCGLCTVILIELYRFTTYSINK